MADNNKDIQKKASLSSAASAASSSVASTSAASSSSASTQSVENIAPRFKQGTTHKGWHGDTQDVTVNIDRRLGSGSFSNVYSASLTSSSKTDKTADGGGNKESNLVAVKVTWIPCDIINTMGNDTDDETDDDETDDGETDGETDDDTDGFDHEAMIAAGQAAQNELSVLRKIERHPNIIQLIDQFVIKNVDDTGFGVLAYALEYMPTTLFDLMELSKHVPDGANAPAHNVVSTSKVEIFTSVMSAVHCVHLSGFVHLDIKAENILIKCSPKERMSVKLCDFGTATQIGQQPPCDGITVSCTAPEVLFECPVQRESDLFGLGCLLFALYTDGESLFPLSLTLDDNHESVMAHLVQVQQFNGFAPFTIKQMRTGIDAGTFLHQNRLRGNPHGVFGMFPNPLKIHGIPKHVQNNIRILCNIDPSKRTRSLQRL